VLAEVRPGFLGIPLELIRHSLSLSGPPVARESG
jgi:hypothetical protein